MLHFNGYDVILLLLPCDLIKQEMLCVAAGALDRTGLKGIGQVRVAQGLQIAAAAASLAEIQAVPPRRFFVLGIFLFELHRTHGGERVVDVTLVAPHTQNTNQVN